jgi:hypothetical protein
VLPLYSKKLCFQKKEHITLMFPKLCIALGQGQTEELWNTSKFCLKDFSQI